MSRRRLWLMRLGVVILIPAMFVAAAEGLLRLIGFGYPTSMFVAAPDTPDTLDSSSFLQTSDQFTFRYFPRALARGVVPHLIAIPKPADTFRIVLFGESAANGDPDPAYGFGRHLEVILNERFPGTRFEVICTAITAINSHVIRDIAADSPQLDADLWIVYMGNNEVIGPFGAGTIFGAQAPPLPFIRASIAAKRTRIGQAIKILTEEQLPAADASDNWEGINLFADNLLHPQDAARQRTHAHFQANLEAILRKANNAGVPVLLSTVASNLKDCAPFASLHQPHLSALSLRQWNEAFNDAKALQQNGDFAAALAAFQRAEAIDGSYAELPFRIGSCHEALGDLNAAYAAYTRARDADALPVRATSAINQIIRDAANSNPGSAVHLLDVVDAFAVHNSGTIPGRNLFFEHVHFNPVGNVEVARLFADAVFELLPPAIRSASTADWPPVTASQRLLAVTLWDQHRLWQQMAQRQSQAPFTARSNNAAEIAYCEMRAQRLDAAKAHPLNQTLYQQAIAARPDDFFLHARFASFLQLNGSPAEAVPLLRQAVASFPDFIAPNQELGVALLLTGQLEEARQYFNKVLSINPAYSKARTAISMIDSANIP